jgi:hypothetical protein
MLSKANVMKIFLGVLMLVLSAAPKLSYADWGVGIHIGGPGYYHDDGRRFYRWHDHPQYGWHMHYLPAGYFTIWVGGERYFYCDGLYYTYVGYGDYVLVEPPIGAYVSAIPPDFQPVLINGVTYYTDNGVYYILTRHHGYRVVAAPVVYAQPQVVVAQPQQVIVSQPATTVVEAPVAGYTQDSFPVNIPNNSGGYSAVVIKKSGNGYVGPQGEFYATFPSVAQLKAMYGK